VPVAALAEETEAFSVLRQKMLSPSLLWLSKKRRGGAADSTILDDESGESSAFTAEDAKPELAVSEDEAAGAADLQDDVAGSRYNWARVAGDTALGTMREILKTDNVFTQGYGGTVIVAKLETYQDALAAAGLAGLYRGPILLTNGKSLHAETKAQLQRINPTKVLVIGGYKAISSNVDSQIRSALGSSVSVARVYGRNAAITSQMIYESGFDSAGTSYWGKTAIIATGNSYKDALSIAPYSYWAGAPIFLVNNTKNPDNRILDADIPSDLRSGGFDQFIIVGGTLAVSYKVEGQLRNLGTGASVRRIAGDNALLTSLQIANWELSQGMGMTHMTVATTKSYKDALCAVPLCGMQNSILVLMNVNGGRTAFDGVYRPSSVTHGHVVGGTAAISASNYNYITNW
jgi:putative cell wall-binding protein